MVGSVVFRADASLHIGTGHVMRCLTLADALSEKGAECQFVCKDLPGNLIGYIRGKGYDVYSLPISTSDKDEMTSPLLRDWLGGSQKNDAEHCRQFLDQNVPNWLIVDHYAIDVRWERLLRPSCEQLMVIDDLANREHDCDLLLDQTCGREASEYRSMAPDACQLLCGSEYALLRPEFLKWRNYSLERRKIYELKQLLISLGGVDKDNVTSQVLRALKSSCLPVDCEITVVMGPNAPWLREVQVLAETLSWNTTVVAGVNNMGQLMADSDLAIGAAGATSWERCCLGLPTIMVVVAENQNRVASSIQKAGAALVVQLAPDIGDSLRSNLLHLTASPERMLDMSLAAAGIVNGCGVATVIQSMERFRDDVTF